MAKHDFEKINSIQITDVCKKLNIALVRERRALGYEIPSFVDVRRFILGTYADAEDIHKRPLTRMIQTVAKKVGVM